MPAEVLLTVVIPVGPGDLSWGEILPQLATARPDGTEIVVSATDPESASLDSVRAMAPGLAIRWIWGTIGRGRQLNRGARAASGRFLWFLHADSRLCEGAIPALLRCLRADEQTLWYFDLRFLADGPRLMRLTEFGVRLRSRLLGLPFGDQGFALMHSLFDALGGFSEVAEYGEDHLFVWAARRASVAVRPVGFSLLTSARKFKRDGWLATTGRHLWRTWKQAAPELLLSAWSQGERR